MRRTATPTHSFTFPESITLSEVTGGKITYFQNGTIKLSKNWTDMTISGQTASLTLTQAETKLFEADSVVEIQIKVKIGTNVAVSDIIRVPVLKVFDDTILN